MSAFDLFQHILSTATTNRVRVCTVPEAQVILYLSLPWNRYRFRFATPPHCVYTKCGAQSNAHYSIIHDTKDIIFAHRILLLCVHTQRICGQWAALDISWSCMWQHNDDYNYNNNHWARKSCTGTMNVAIVWLLAVPFVHTRLAFLVLAHSIVNSALIIMYRF
jgi:hypothetical protein